MEHSQRKSDNNENMQADTKELK